MGYALRVEGLPASGCWGAVLCSPLQGRGGGGSAKCVGGDPRKSAGAGGDAFKGAGGDPGNRGQPIEEPHNTVDCTTVNFANCDDNGATINIVLTGRALSARHVPSAHRVSSA